MTAGLTGPFPASRASGVRSSSAAMVCGLGGEGRFDSSWRPHKQAKDVEDACKLRPISRLAAVSDAVAPSGRATATRPAPTGPRRQCEKGGSAHSSRTAACQAACLLATPRVASSCMRGESALWHPSRSGRERGGNPGAPRRLPRCGRPRRTSGVTRRTPLLLAWTAARVLPLEAPRRLLHRSVPSTSPGGR